MTTLESDQPVFHLDFVSSRWPQSIWSAGRVQIQSDRSPDKTIEWIGKRLRQDFRYRRDLSEPFDQSDANAGITRLRPLPWKPIRPAAVFDGMMHAHDAGTVITGELRLPWWPLLWCCLCVLGGVFISIPGINPASFIFPFFGAIVYLGGRFVSLPSASGSFLAWWPSDSGTASIPTMQPTHGMSPRGQWIAVITTLSLITIATGALLLYTVASTISEPKFQNTSSYVIAAISAVWFLMTVAAIVGIWRRWPVARLLGIVGGALMAITCIGAVLGIPLIIATIIATGLRPTAVSQLGSELGAQ